MTQAASTSKPTLLQANGRNDCTVGQLLTALADEPGLFALESSCNTAGYGRFSIVGVEPIDEIHTRRSVGQSGEVDPFEALEVSVDGLPRVDLAGHAFAGGWVGYVPYECGLPTAGLPLPDSAAPRFALHDSAAVYDHEAHCWTIGAVDLEKSRRPADERIRQWQERLQRAASSVVPELASAMPRAESPSIPPSNMTREAYFEKVERAIEYIRAGDIFQVNLTQRFTTNTYLDPLSLYLRLQQVNPADYSAFLAWPDQAVLSVSPELFVQLQPNGTMLTRPIKGTRPRMGDDASKRRELRNSPKDRAELTMIVDLLRNDFGRVCRFGSINVVDAAEVETHPTVHHLVASIVGQADPDIGRVDVLRAMFPGGSITGCPKIRAMQIIDELESTPREAYCGAIGYFGVDGSMNMNIAIRTMIQRGRSVHVYAGGAITADSNPADELEETLAKARGMFRALGIAPENAHATDHSLAARNH